MDTEDIDISKILNRDLVEIDNESIENLIKDKVILVTGAGGSIGSELCRQIMKYYPKQILMLDIYENNLYEIERELEQRFESNLIGAVIGSVRDENRLRWIFEKYRPNIVFHAAAHKHVPLMEESPVEAIKNNIFGTYNVVNFADEFDVSKFVLISTDKAVNPTSVMGATKKFCEMVVGAKNKISKTKYVIVRFGNVLGSNGSVIPLFKKQIENNLPVTVTDKRATRFFMTIPEAVKLILQAVSDGNDGEMFVLDMGEQINIYDLAITLIKMAGKKPYEDVPIEIIGLRPGEKLHEEIFTFEEELKTTQHNKIFVAKPLEINQEDIERKIEVLKKCVLNENMSNEDAMKLLK